MKIFILVGLLALSQSSILEKEREILLSMKVNIEKQLLLLQHTDLNVDNMLKKETGESVNIVQPEIKFSNKRMQLLEFYNNESIKQDERIIGVHIMGYRYHIDQSTKSKKIPLTVIVTNRNFYVMKDRQVVAVAEMLSNAEVIKVDFSQFSEEDSNIVIYTNNAEISILSISMSVKITTEEVKLILFKNISVSVAFPTRRIVNINHKDNLVKITQEKLHNNNYLILAYENGTVL
jgi:hypothetical protein